MTPPPWAQRTLTLLLAPVLLAQGRYTRAVTPRLPEPEGARAGLEGSGPTLRLLIAGDSAAAGVGAPDQQEALSGQLVSELAPHYALHWKLVAQTGYTTADLLRRLALEPPQAFDAVALSLGVNDVTGALRTHAWLAQQRELLALLQQRFAAQHVVLTCVPPMQRFTALPQPLRQMLGWRAQRFNEALDHAVRNWPEARGCEMLHLRAPMSPDALAPDGFHPGRATYRLWAQALAQRLKVRFPSG